MKMNLSLPLLLALFTPMLSLGADSTKSVATSCTGKMPKKLCEKLLFDPLNLGMKTSESDLGKRFGKPISRNKVKDSERGTGFKLIYSDKEIWIYTEEETVITYVSLKKPAPEIPKEVNVGSTEQSVIEQLGKGSKRGNTRTYCNQDELDCLRFQFKNKKTESIEWLPYSD